eukprot:10312734-Prorocentrum_lima.AAC.1
MTSSLVGSEMCIRDRSREVWRRCQSPEGRSQSLRRQERRRLAMREGRDCLLYTSDAADDM